MKKRNLVVLTIVILLLLGACGKSPEINDSVETESVTETHPETEATGEPYCEGCVNGWLICDEDGDWKCDVTGVVVCDESHVNSHFDIAEENNCCNACGVAMVTEPHVYMADDTLCFTPGMISNEGESASYDTIDSMFEVYNLDTGELICSRSRSEFDNDRSAYFSDGVYNVEGKLNNSALKVHISEITDATTCNIGVRAKSLDENYADSSLVAVEYTAASQLEPLNVTIDENGILTIGNRNESCTYYLYVANYEPFSVWWIDPFSDGSVDLMELVRNGYMPYPPQDGCYVLMLYENSGEGRNIASVWNKELPVSAIGHTWHGNYETLNFYVSADEYSPEPNPGPEPTE